MTSDALESTAVLFDIDGTLVDSNYLHVEAWDRAFVAVGHPHRRVADPPRYRNGLR
ncbi:HAD family hydrolase [Microbacterium sp. A1-JK]|uniref:HAD family hydrolase n=1 Tax=Microbacterium sp. A1-JK TaxID=3177516 RepID=UPI0038869649